MTNTEEAEIRIHCVQCKELHIFKVPLERYQRWRSGEFIQNCLPELTPAQREMFISGVCEKCWKRMFGEG